MTELSTQKSLIILDRDGVINHDSDHFIKHPKEWIPYVNSLMALSLLKEKGIQVAIATNQSGVGRGLFNEAMLQDIHKKMRYIIKSAGGNIDFIAYCPHHPDIECDCRKPKAGLLEQIQNHYQIELENVPVIGDSWRDLQPAVSKKATPILVKTGKGLKTLENHREELRNINVFDDLLQAVEFILSNQFHI